MGLGSGKREFTSTMNSSPYLLDSTRSTQQSIFRQFYGSSVNLPLELGLTNIRRGCGTDGAEGEEEEGRRRWETGPGSHRDGTLADGGKFRNLGRQDKQGLNLNDHKPYLPTLLHTHMSLKFTQLAILPN